MDKGGLHLEHLTRNEETVARDNFGVIVKLQSFGSRFTPVSLFRAQKKSCLELAVGWQF